MPPSPPPSSLLSFATPALWYVKRKAWPIGSRKKLTATWASCALSDCHSRSYDKKSHHEPRYDLLSENSMSGGRERFHESLPERMSEAAGCGSSSIRRKGKTLQSQELYPESRVMNSRPYFLRLE